MSRLCRLKTASHGDDGKWAYGEIIKLRQAIESQAAEIEKYKALCDLLGDALELGWSPLPRKDADARELATEALTAWRSMK